MHKFLIVVAFYVSFVQNLTEFVQFIVVINAISGDNLQNTSNFIQIETFCPILNINCIIHHKILNCMSALYSGAVANQSPRAEVDIFLTLQMVTVGNGC